VYVIRIRWNYVALSKNEFSLLVAIFTFHRTKAKYLATSTAAASAATKQLKAGKT